MLSSFYYYSLASPDHFHEGAYRLNIISTTISSLIRKALCYWNLLVLHQQPARGWVLYNTSRSSGKGIMSRMSNGTNYNRSVKLRQWNVDRVILFRVPGLGISKSGKFLLKLRACHSGKFAPREINPGQGFFPGGVGGAFAPPWLWLAPP